MLVFKMGLTDRDNELVQITDAAFASASLRAGDWLVCRMGCTQCCVGAFAITALDVARLLRGMTELRTDDPQRAERVLTRARMWLDEFGATFPGDPATGVLGQSDEQIACFEEYANDAVCPALDPATGGCDLYAWRPMTCRVFGPPVRMDAGPNEATGEPTSALAHCELCFTTATAEDVARCEMDLPHELESSLLEELATAGRMGETTVAFALGERSESINREL